MDASQQTLRITGLPPNCEERDVEHFFNERITRHRGRQIIERVGPITSYGSGITKRTTVSFSSHNTAQKALDLQETNRRLSAEKGGSGIITLDHSFLDLTTLHSSVNPETGKPDIDVVALHGLTGHAWNSFTTSNVVDPDAGRTKETNWLRDILPRLLEQDRQQAIYPRVMTYGFDADVWMTRTVADLDVPVTNLLTYLDTERIEDPGRPLFFIGHSLGGIVIKQAIVALANEAMKTILQHSQSGIQYNFPVEGCLFFGVPNLGTEYADGAAKILKVLNTVFNVNRNVVQELVNKSQRLANIASEFRQIRNEHKIPVISFFETVKYNNVLGLIVNKDSAVVEYPGSPRPFGITRNHKEMVRFPHDAAHALEPAIFHLAQFSRNALASRRPSRPGPYPYTYTSPPSSGQPGPTTGEDRFGKLETYDTVFLVDDSPSMSGNRWDLVKRILTYSLALATQYDTDGIDIHFLNNRSANANNVKDQAIAVEIHRQITLRGSTPILDQLSRHLNDYVRRFTAQDEMNFKGYNLIVLTDGDPDPEYEDINDISDREDARVTRPAYRLIRKKLVQIAQSLQKAGAERTQVGIQFCQVGDDQEASSFFQYLDNRLKGKYDLDRDMVDTIKCQSEADLTEPFFRKLLLGAIDKGLDHEETTVEPSSSYNNYTHQPSQPTRTATVREDRQQQGGRAKTWAMDQRMSESSHQVGQQSHSDPKTTTLNHLYNTPNTPHQPPRYFTEQNFHEIPEKQQPFPENSLPHSQRPPTHRLTHTLSMPPDDTREERPKQPHHRGSLGLGLNKFWRGHQDP